jgi:hypothetical protein
MATLANVADTIHGNMRVAFRDVTFSNSYATGGESITPAQVGVNKIFQVLPDQGVSGLLFNYDYVNSKLKATYPTGGATASPAALAAPQVTTGASTASAVNATTPALTPGQGKEVAAATDLSSVVVRTRFIGQ